ncbi:MAG: bifunctional hydroxymethylpyrimidine kinase/phosphomethylpyrimidine kinase, partial [Candidatus Methanomethyliaceae archaeon]|nr:bifunctional hydroxymethylpyrimidine kinase/phosphomethylpyrimidine kinase [Candidatus Methanomethyliaceae archaeon]
HGTGCTFSAAIAACLALGLSIENAFAEAKKFVTNAIKYGLRIGKGVGPVEPMSNLRIDAERYRVISKMYDALRLLESSPQLSKLTPECQINLVMALPYPFADSIEAVCGIPGRITNIGGRLRPSSCPTFGASKHLARLIITVMEYDSNVRSAMNIKYSKEIIETCEKLGWIVSYYDRCKEPEEIKAKEGATIPWGTREAIKSVGRVPDIIYHTGDYGKEPMIVILGRDPLETVSKAIKLAESLA